MFFFSLRAMAQLCVRRLISNLRQLPVSAASFISKRQFANEASPEDYGYCKCIFDSDVVNSVNYVFIDFLA